MYGSSMMRIQLCVSLKVSTIISPCSKILFMPTLPSITSVFSMVIEHERQNGLSPVQDDSVPQINVVDGKRYSNKNKLSGPRQCTFCNRQGHTMDTCYKKHGLPFGSKITN